MPVLYTDANSILIPAVHSAKVDFVAHREPSIRRGRFSHVPSILPAQVWSGGLEGHYDVCQHVMGL